MLQTLFDNSAIFINNIAEVLNQFSNWLWYDATTQQVLLILFASVIGFRFLISLLRDFYAWEDKTRTEFYAWQERMKKEWQDRKAQFQENKNSLLQLLRK